MALNPQTTADKLIGARERANAKVLLVDIAAGLQMAAIADLNQDISAAYVEAEVQAISDKVDALLAALRSAGLLAS
jgi:acetolactate synthase small subunit